MGRSAADVPDGAEPAADVPEGAEEEEEVVPKEVLGEVHAGVGRAYEGRGFADAIGDAPRGAHCGRTSARAKTTFWGA